MNFPIFIAGWDGVGFDMRVFVVVVVGGGGGVGWNSLLLSSVIVGASFAVTTFIAGGDSIS